MIGQRITLLDAFVGSLDKPRASMPSTCVAFFESWYGLTLTLGQRVLVKVAIDRVPLDALDDDERAVAEEMFGDLSDAPELAWRTIVAACGRSSGKTELGAGIALYLLLTVDISRCGPGDIPRGFVVAPDKDTAALTIERAAARIEASPELSALLIGKPLGLSIRLRRLDGREVRLEVRSANRGGKSMRGRSIIVVILDEAAFFTSDGFAVNDAEIVRALKPRLVKGGIIALLSTLWMDEGYFYEQYNKNREVARSAIVAHAPTLVMRDHDPELAALIESEREDDPDNVAREFDCVSVAVGSSNFFDPKLLAAAVRDFNPDEFKGRAAGGDIGLITDASAIAITGFRGAGAGFEIADIESEEYRPEEGKPLKLSRVVAGFAAVMKPHGVREVTADGHAREPAREWADENRITIVAAPEGNAGKMESHQLVRQLLLEGRLFLRKQPRLIAQLRAVRSKPMQGGGYQLYTLRRKGGVGGGGHGDLASAFIAGCWAAQESSYAPASASGFEDFASAFGA